MTPSSNLPTSLLERAIMVFDRSLRVFAGSRPVGRPSPAQGAPLPELSAAERRDVEGLMRVNHTGEVCAQALYLGQALFAHTAQTQRALDRAGREEWDHLAWCEQRLHELDGRTSRLNALWYSGSFLMGAGYAVLGDRWNMAFLAETERQVERHLDGHLERLPMQDQRSRLILETMRREEALHAEMAEQNGAATLPGPVKVVMRATARLMTRTAYWI